MYRVTDVVKNLLIINILMYFGTMFLGDPSNEQMSALVGGQMDDFSAWGRYRLAIFYPASEYFRPFQVVSHLFMHGSLTHLFFNMFALFMFGPPLEILWGPKRFLYFYFFTGFGALALHLFVRYLDISFGSSPGYMINIPSLGASGAVFGLLMGYGVSFPNNIIQLLIPPIPIKAKYFVMIYAGIELFLGLGNFNTGVAHFAHLGGALFGFLLMMYWRHFGTRL